VWLTAVSGCWIYDNLVRPCFEADEIVGPSVSQELVDLELHFSKLRILYAHQCHSKNYLFLAASGAALKDLDWTP